MGLLAIWNTNCLGAEKVAVRPYGTPAWLVPHRVFEGNRPTNTLLPERLRERRVIG